MRRKEMEAPIQQRVVHGGRGYGGMIGSDRLATVLVCLYNRGLNVRTPTVL